MKSWIQLYNIMFGFACNDALKFIIFCPFLRNIFTSLGSICKAPSNRTTKDKSLLLTNQTCDEVKCFFLRGHKKKKQHMLVWV